MLGHPGISVWSFSLSRPVPDAWLPLHRPGWGRGAPPPPPAPAAQQQQLESLHTPVVPRGGATPSHGAEHQGCWQGKALQEQEEQGTREVNELGKILCQLHDPSLPQLVKNAKFITRHVQPAPIQTAQICGPAQAWPYFPFSVPNMRPYKGRKGERERPAHARGPSPPPGLLQEGVPKPWARV